LYGHNDIAIYICKDLEPFSVPPTFI